MSKPHECNRETPLKHPWRPNEDAWCGYAGKYDDERCKGCYRVRNAPYRQITPDMAKVQRAWNQRWAR